MLTVHKLTRFPLCLLGVHVLPDLRNPHGPVVADCACCGKTCYYYGVAIQEIDRPPVLLLQTPVRLLSTKS